LNITDVEWLDAQIARLASHCSSVFRVELPQCSSNVLPTNDGQPTGPVEEDEGNDKFTEDQAEAEDPALPATSPKDTPQERDEDQASKKRKAAKDKEASSKRQKNIAEVESDSQSVNSAQEGPLGRKSSRGRTIMQTQKGAQWSKLVGEKKKR